MDCARGRSRCRRQGRGGRPRRCRRARQPNPGVRARPAGSLASQPAWLGPPGSAGALGDIDADGRLDLVAGTAIFPARNPWLAPDGGPSASLPNNPAHVRRARVTPAGTNQLTITFDAVDVESDLLWIVGEYQFEGAPLWRPMDLG